jgi:GT2 family glycosyltransferase
MAPTYLLSQPMQARLSVIIVNYNVKHFLEQCLLSVQRACEKLPSEIIVVDNHSLDGSVEMLRRKFPNVKLIASEKNLGFSKGNNLGIAQAGGEFILLLNPDTVIEESTFEKTIAFMDARPEAGALGVKMIDGKGRFLPESKRGLPTPEVAFYKMFGLAALFPQSLRFGKYHLTYLDKDKTHEVDILSGAFFLVRREVLNKIGLLDETFFMYGEDIDLSYRIQQAGYKNYYFADTSIIHYKGESTKKTSVNYVFVFYKAMAIFARKHYSKQKANSLSLLINVAILLRASITLMGNILRTSRLMLLDAILFFGLFLALRQLYFFFSGKVTPLDISVWFFAGMSILWVCIGWLRSAYDRPYSLRNFSKGMLIGGLLALVVYALLPENLRFSRAIVLSGAVAGWIIGIAARWVLATLFPISFRINTLHKRRFAIVGQPGNALRVEQLLYSAGFEAGFIARVHPDEVEQLPENYAATMGQLRELCRIFQLDEIIFCAEDVGSQRIIEQMMQLDGEQLDFKIAPPESMFVIGSNSTHTVGELYFVLNVNSIGKVGSKRNKRIFDIIASVILLLASPLRWIKKDAIGSADVWKVLIGNKTLVGYNPAGDNLHELPPLRPGLFYPAPKGTNGKAHTVARLNMLYAKDYSIWKDAAIVWGQL